MEVKLILDNMTNNDAIFAEMSKKLDNNVKEKNDL